MTSLAAILILNLVRISHEQHHRVFIQGLFEMNASGDSQLAAARLAISHVNALNIIPGYNLTMYTNDTKGDSGAAVDAFFHAVYRKPQMVMLLGPGCSQVAEQLAYIASYWNLVQVCFGSVSSILSDRKSYPLFYRTATPDSSHNAARTAFAVKFRWETVALFTQAEDEFTLGVNNLMANLESSNISVGVAYTFTLQDFHEKLVQLKDKDYRVVVASLSSTIAPNLFCEVFHQGMFGGEYVWILHSGLRVDWWASTQALKCSNKQLASTVEGAFVIGNHYAIGAEQISISGLTTEEFMEELAASGHLLDPEVVLVYDAVWAMALTLKEADRKWSGSLHPLRIADFNYTRKDMTAIFSDIMSNLSFNGLSGPVSFRGGDRVGISAFHQIQRGALQKVALYFPGTKELDFECSFCNPIIWHDGHVPIARRVFTIRIRTVEEAAFVVVTVLAILGMSLAAIFLVFNLHFRRFRFIKLSSPNLNNIAVVGCLLVYAAIILLGLDHRTLMTENHFSVVCISRALLLCIGFSLAFGSMFTKTYRVHKILVDANSGIVKSKLLKDHRLIFLVGVLLLIDCTIISLWATLDPPQRHLRNLTIEIDPLERDIVYLPQVEECVSEHGNKWMGALYVYKGLLLVVGVYMAWETRHVKIQAMNDSQYIGMNVYNVVITSVIVVVVANLISDRRTLSYVVVSAIIFASTTMTLCLLFIPKIHLIWKHPEGDPIVEMGLKLESNTRRFVVDEKKELFYRVEVQNRVYKRELAQLQEEVARLEFLLESKEDLASDKWREPLANKEFGDIIEVDNEKMLNQRRSRRWRSGSSEVGRGPMLPKLLCLEAEIHGAGNNPARLLEAPVTWMWRNLKTSDKRKSLPEIVITSPGASEDKISFFPERMETFGKAGSEGHLCPVVIRKERDCASEEDNSQYLSKRNRKLSASILGSWTKSRKSSACSKEQEHLLSLSKSEAVKSNSGLLRCQNCQFGD